MEQFSLEKYLENKSRKITTRYGDRKVRIICTDRKAKLPIVTLMTDQDGNEYVTYHTTNGWCNEEEKYPDKRDLFFADDEEELTELQKTLEEDCDYYVNLYNDGKTREELREWIKCWCNSIIDLARKEILKDLPKWKKANEHLRGEGFIHYDKHNMTLQYADTNVEGGEYYMNIEDLKTLPKE